MTTALVPVYPQPPGRRWLPIRLITTRFLTIELEQDSATEIIRESHTLILKNPARFGRCDCYYYHPQDPEDFGTIEHAEHSARRKGLIA